MPLRTLITAPETFLGQALLRAIDDAVPCGEFLPQEPFDRIIHTTHYQQRHQNLDMLQRLFTVPCGKLVYLSSPEVHRAFSVDNKALGLAFLRCEQFIRSSYDDYLIVRAEAPELEDLLSLLASERMGTVTL